jgi:sugar phosphate isomerase/epimerase
MLIGYNTNGLAHHDGIQAVEILAEIGYRAVALTVDHALLSPRHPRLSLQRGEVHQLLCDHGMRSVIETGARFLLDPRTKHFPTLLSSDPVQRGRRLEFLVYCVELAAELGSDCVSLWSGAADPGQSEDRSFGLLADGLFKLLEKARQYNVPLAFEPEPGMLIDTMARFRRLVNLVDDDYLRLTLDVGHLQCQGETPLRDQIREWGDRLNNVHLEDMRTGRHEHLMFGEGEIDFCEVISALRSARYRWGVYVELSRHSHDGVAAARRAFEFLSPLLAAEVH